MEMRPFCGSLHRRVVSYIYNIIIYAATLLEVGPTRYAGWPESPDAPSVSGEPVPNSSPVCKLGRMRIIETFVRQVQQVLPDGFAIELIGTFAEVLGEAGDVVDVQADGLWSKVPQFHPVDHAFA